MIDEIEIEQVREINRRLPFADPIAQVVEPTTRLFFAPADSFDPAAPTMADLAGWTEITGVSDITWSTP